MNTQELLQALKEERDFCKKMQNSNGYIVAVGLATAHYNSEGEVFIAHVASKAKAMAKADAERMLKEHFTSIKKGVLVAVTPKLEVASEWFKKRYEDYKTIVELQKNNNI